MNTSTNQCKGAVCRNVVPSVNKQTDLRGKDASGDET